MHSMLPKKVVDLARRVIAENLTAGRRISVAESCTGGLVCAALTEIPGSSAVLQFGYVTYANDAKMQTLGVSSELLETFGAVSIAAAWAMAQGALEKSGSDIAIAISGVAGPDGGSVHKPVGTVVFAIAEKGKDPEDVFAGRENFGTELSRAEVRLAATMHALNLLLPQSAATP
jgi:nicotinamide-nucleotide amidase